MLQATFAAVMLFAFRWDAAHIGHMCKVAGHPAELAVAPKASDSITHKWKEKRELALTVRHTWSRSPCIYIYRYSAFECLKRNKLWPAPPRCIYNDWYIDYGTNLPQFGLTVLRRAPIAKMVARPPPGAPLTSRVGMMARPFPWSGHPNSLDGQAKQSEHRQNLPSIVCTVRRQPAGLRRRMFNLALSLQRNNTPRQRSTGGPT
jgi:hypothetical protein